MTAAKQAIAGVAPPELSEVTVATAWPSIAATRLGRLLGRLYAIDLGFGMFTVGKLLALASIPVVLLLFFGMLSPWTAPRYRLTNRRMTLERGVRGRLDRAVGLGDFDRVSIELLPGQAWYSAGDLVFRQGEREVFRAAGIARPEPLRQTILKTAQAFGMRWSH